MTRNNLAAWGAVAGLVATVLALVIYFTGSPSFFGLFRSGTVAEPVSDEEYTTSLDMLDLTQVQVFALPSPLPYGANNQFIGDRLLVSRFGEDKGVFLLQCRADRQCRRQAISLLRDMDPQRAFFFDNQLYVVGPQQYDWQSTRDDSIDFGSRVDSPESAIDRVVYVNLLSRTVTQHDLLSGGCPFHSLDSTIEEIAPAEDDRIRIDVISWCDQITMGVEQGRVPLRDDPSFLIEYQIVGRFDTDGRFKTSSITGRGRLDE